MLTKISRQKSTTRIAILALLLTALLIRSADLSTKTLWYDELQSVTYADLPLADLLESVQQFDPHPPLYYIQLYLWLLAGTADFWIKLNSLFWSLLSIAILYVVISAIFDENVGILAAFLLTISPFSVAYAQEARMYTQIMVLGIGVFYFTHQFLYGDRPWRMGGGIIVVTVAFLYSHGAGFLILVSGSTYAAIYLLTAKIAHGRRWKRFIQWLLLQIAIIILYLPWLARAYAINLSHTLKPDVETIFHTLSILLLGFGELPFWLRLGSVLITLGLIALLLQYDRASRPLVIAFVIMPVVISLAISYLYRPIWLHRTLAYTVPFWSVTIALAITRSAALLHNRIHNRSGRDIVRYGFLTAVSLLFFLALRSQQSGSYYPWRIREAATFIRHVAAHDDQIYVPYSRLYWGFTWYFLGPGSVNPLATKDELTTNDGIHIFSVNAAQDPLAKGTCYWIIYRDVDETTPFQIRAALIINDFDGLMIARLCLPAE